MTPSRLPTHTLTYGALMATVYDLARACNGEPKTHVVMIGELAYADLVLDAMAVASRGDLVALRTIPMDFVRGFRIEVKSDFDRSVAVVEVGL